MKIQLSTMLISSALFFSTNIFANEPIQNGEIESKIDKEVRDIRQDISVDAFEAVNQTHVALLSLEIKKPDEAITAIKSAIGKLDLVLKRYPNLNFKPIHAEKTINKLSATPKIIKLKIKTAKKQLDAGNLQEARLLLAPLVSDITLTVTSIPLGAYSKTLKSVVALIDGAKIDEAKIALSSLLNTLVVKKIITPLPLLMAKALLMEAKIQAGKENRSDEENKALAFKLKEARNQLKISQLLGYGDKKLFKPLHEQIDQIEKETADGKTGKGLFEKIEKLVPDFSNT